MSEKGLSLFEIEDTLAALIETEELTPDDQRLEVLHEIVKSSQAAVGKRDKCIQFLRHLEFQQTAIDQEIERLTSLRDHYARGEKNFKNYLVNIIETFSPYKKRLEGSIGILALAKNPDSVLITDAGTIPMEFKQVEIKLTGRDYVMLLDRLATAGLLEEGTLLAGQAESVPRKSLLKEALQDGEEIPGAEIRAGSHRLVVR